MVKVALGARASESQRMKNGGRNWVKVCIRNTKDIYKTQVFVFVDLNVHYVDILLAIGNKLCRRVLSLIVSNTNA